MTSKAGFVLRCRTRGVCDIVEIGKNWFKKKQIYAKKQLFIHKNIQIAIFLS